MSRPDKSPPLPTRTYAIPLVTGKVFIRIARKDGKVRHVFTSTRSTNLVDLDYGAVATALAGLIWIAIDSGCDVHRIIKVLKGIKGGHATPYEDKVYLSLPDAIAKVLEEDEQIEREDNERSV